MVGNTEGAMKGHFVVLTLFSAIVGCVTPEVATTEKYEAALRTWFGASESQLLSKWGPPSHTYPLPDGGKMLTWMDSSGAQSSTTYNPFTRSFETDNYSYWCKTTFTISPSGVITKARYEGNKCRAK
jgi:hypothetical protein